MIKCYLLSLPMNKYVVITAMVVLDSPLPGTLQRSYCEIEYNLPVTPIYFIPRVKVDKIALFKFIPQMLTKCQQASCCHNC